MATKPLQAGDLDRKITILQWDTHKDSVGETAKSQSPLAIVWANKKDNPSSADNAEKSVSDRETAFRQTQFTIRYRNDLNETMQVQCEGVTYDILNITEGEGRHQWTVINTRKHD